MSEIIAKRYLFNHANVPPHLAHKISIMNMELIEKLERVAKYMAKQDDRYIDKATLYDDISQMIAEEVFVNHYR